MTPAGVAAENRSWRSAVSAYTSGSAGRRTTTLPSSAIHLPGRSTSCARRQPMDGSTQCHADAATRTSKRRPPSSHSLERRILDLDVAEGAEPLASKRGHARAGLDGGHRVPERCQRACRLTGTAAHLKHRGPPVHAEIEMATRSATRPVLGPRAVVVLALVEYLTELTSIRCCHRSNPTVSCRRTCRVRARGADLASPGTRRAAVAIGGTASTTSRAPRSAWSTP